MRQKGLAHLQLFSTRAFLACTVSAVVVGVGVGVVVVVGGKGGEGTKNADGRRVSSQES